MDRRRRSSGLLAAGAAALVAVGAIFALSREPIGLGVFRLGDGSTLKLEAVTYGRQHRFVGGRWWQRFLSPLMPASLRGLIDAASPIERTSDSKSIMFWVSRTGPGWPPGHTLRAALCDERGRELDLGTSPEPGWRSGEVWSCMSTVFPRRGKWVRLRLYPSSGRRPPACVAEFRVPNPAHGPYPTWTAEPLPVTRRDGDLAVTLAALETGLRDKGPVRPPWSRGEGIWTCATVRMTQNGRPSRDWRLTWVSLTDATGNRLDPIGLSPLHGGGGAHAVFLGSLWPDETAWKVRIQYARAAHFTRPDLWTVRGVPVARRGVFSHFQARASRHGATLQLLGMAGAHSLRMEDGILYYPRDELPSILVEAGSPEGPLPVGKGLELTLLRASDDRGRPVVGTLTSITSAGEYNFELKTAPDSKRVSLTFAVAKDRVVECVVKPSWG